MKGNHFIQIFLWQKQRKENHMAVLKAENLKKIYGSGSNEVKALDGVDLMVEKWMRLDHYQLI